MMKLNHKHQRIKKINHELEDTAPDYLLISTIERVKKLTKIINN